MPSFRRSVALALGLVALVLVISSAPSRAQAQYMYQHRDAHYEYRVALLGGGATRVKQNEIDYRWSGGAVGVEAGVTLPISLYLGAHFLEIIGENLALENGSARASTQHVLADIGYDVHIRHFILRPRASLGAEGLFAVQGVAPQLRPGHVWSPIVLAGAGILYDVGKWLFVGVDLLMGYAFRPGNVTTLMPIEPVTGAPAVQPSMSPILEGVGRVGARF